MPTYDSHMVLSLVKAVAMKIQTLNQVTVRGIREEVQAFLRVYKNTPKERCGNFKWHDELSFTAPLSTWVVGTCRLNRRSTGRWYFACWVKKSFKTSKKMEIRSKSHKLLT